jgi:taurine transport system permease protein
MIASRKTIVGAVTLIVLVTAWEVLTTPTGLVNTGRFPPPELVWQSFRQAATTGYADATLLQHDVRSLALVAMGFGVAVSVGVPLGLLMRWNRKAVALINPVFSLIRPILPLAWNSLAIPWLDIGEAAKIMVIFFAAFVPPVITTFTDVRAIEPPIIEAAQMLGTGRWRFIGESLIPAALPMIFTGLHLSLQASWTTLVAAEPVSDLSGHGRVLNSAQQDIYPAMLVVGMIAVCVLAWATTRLLGLVENCTMPWQVLRA